MDRPSSPWLWESGKREAFSKVAEPPSLSTAIFPAECAPEFLRRPVAQAAMWALLVVLVSPRSAMTREHITGEFRGAVTKNLTRRRIEMIDATPLGRELSRTASHALSTGQIWRINCDYDFDYCVKLSRV